MGQDDPSGEVRTGAARPLHGPDPVTEADRTPVKTPTAAGTNTSTVAAPTDGSSDSVEPDEPDELDEPTEPAPVVETPVQDESITNDAGTDDAGTDDAAIDPPVQAAPVAEESAVVDPPADPVAVDEPAAEPGDVTLLIKGGQDADLVAPDRTVFIRGGQFSLDRPGESAVAAETAAADPSDPVTPPDEPEHEPDESEHERIDLWAGREPRGLPDPPTQFWQEPDVTHRSEEVTAVVPAEDLAARAPAPPTISAPPVAPPAKPPGAAPVAPPDRKSVV